ncbi:MAG: alpha/beta fold hydrolase [Candidatus Obscuribacterales bacterium]
MNRMNSKFLLNSLLSTIMLGTITLPTMAADSNGTDADGQFLAIKKPKSGLTGGVQENITPTSVVRENVNEFSQSLKIPIIKWSQHDSQAPQAVLVALHGSTLHSGVFEEFSRQMVGRGYMVVAPDMRGFGRWRTDSKNFENGAKIEFYKDRADLVNLLQMLRNQYPKTPLYCIGESLGGNLSLWVASVHPDLVDGIILSSPCIKRHWCINRTLAVDFFKAARFPHREVPTAPYAKRYLSESKEVTAAYLADPGIRKAMTAYESFQSFHVNRSCLLYAENVPQDMPILVIEGTNDRMYVSKAVGPLMKRVPSSDETVHYLKNRGHIHLETPHIKEDVVETVDDWLRTHIQTESARKRSTPASISANPEQL